MPRLPSWVPYRVRDAWDTRRIGRAVRGLRHTPPAPAAAADRAGCEVHMLLCRRDVPVGVLALKSLLRFRELSAAVAVTDDGSLRPADHDFVNQHIPGCRWLPPHATGPRIDAALGGRPHLAALYAGPYPPARKLVHPAALAAHPRAVVLDADTATFRRPDQLLAWASGAGPRNLFLSDRRQAADAVPAAARTALDGLGGVVAPGRAWRLAHPFLNSGLLAVHPADLDLDVAERYLTWWAGADVSLRTGRNGIWFGPWTPEQTCYLMMLSALAVPPVAFDEGYGIGHGEPDVFRHFLRAGLVDPATLRRVLGLVGELGAATRAGG